MFFTILPVRFFKRKSKKDVSPDTCSADVANQRTDSLSLVVLMHHKKSARILTRIQGKVALVAKHRFLAETELALRSCS